MESNTDSLAHHPAMAALLIVVALLGLLLIGFGIWALAGGIFAGWELFRNPESIDYFASYFLETTQIATQLEIGGKGLAHYIAWMTVILLLLVLGKLGVWAVTAGAQILAALRSDRH